MDSIAAGELPQADGISWKYKNSIEFPKTDHELSGHGSFAQVLRIGFLAGPKY
jgi:hypothetical protein